VRNYKKELKKVFKFQVMSKKKYKEKEITPDPVYHDILVSKFINRIMMKGKKFLARRITYKAFEIIKNQTKKEPLEVFQKALEMAGPRLEVRSQRVGGATYQVPREVKGKRKESLAIRWIIEAARNKKGKTMEERLAHEIIAVSKGEGEVIRKKINVQKMAEANRAFAYLAR
jgi:small subunit ribosomal protein S7